MLQRSNMGVLLLALIIYANPALSQLDTNEFGEVKPTPVLRQNPQDVATVLVADINNRGAHGRFINIKPEIGLLKSTARTFVQDGIKTEYVTKVIGTTIDNGQYVQLLTTTSRVLYNSDNQQTKTVNFNAIDGNDEASFLNSPPSSPFLQNVDYIVPNNPYLVFPARNSRNNNDNNNVISYNNLNIHDNDNEESEIAIKAEKLVESPRAAQIPQPAKVIPEGNLPTYTVSHDGPIFEAQAPKANPAPRVGKVITYEQELKEAETAPKVLPSVTYFGFADFTTTVGDTVIIFSPSTAKPQIDKDHITSIKGEPTLSIQPTTTKQQHITFEEADSSIVEPRFTPKIAETAMPTLPTTPEYKETTKSEEEETTTTTTTESTTSTTTTTSRKLTTTAQETTTEEILTTTNESEEEDSSEETDIPTTTSPLPTQKPIIRVVGITTPESIESSQVSSITTPKYTKPSEEDLQRILASLASQKVNEEKSSVIDTSPIVSSNAETKVLSGTSIIFFDYDEPVDITTQKTELVTLPSTTTSTTTTTTTTEANESSDEEEEDDDEEEESTSEKQQPEKKVEEEEEATTEAIAIKPLTPRPAEIEDKEGCSSTMLQTLKFLTTFYVPQDEIITTTSVKTRQVIATKVVPIECSIKPTSVTSELETTKYVTEDINKAEEEVTHASNDDVDDDDDKESETTTTVKATTQKPETTTMEIVTESSTVEEETTVENLDDEEDIEVIYKTLYTTYTYLTTFFQESTSTVSSRKDVVTNVITSTINANDFASLLSKFEPSKPDDDSDIQPTQVDHGVGRPTEKFILPESDFIGVNLLLDNEKVDYTPALTDDDIGNEIKTLYTTYTYFTTLFNEGTNEVATRTEVYTNIINPSSSLANVLQRDVLESKFVDIEKDDNSLADSRKEGKKLKIEGDFDGNDIKYSTMIRNASELSQNEDSASTWDDVKSSTSEGERSYIENIDRRHYTELEDQISSESNIEEGIPSPTLLLQTRYTTFTYYTTVYTGGTSSNILSRLETLTNVVTETLSPTQVQKLDDATVPVTYFTTFTYWTTFYKDGKTETTSREETLSNVITPSLAVEQESSVASVEIASSLPTQVIQTESTSSSSVLADSTLLVQPLQPVVEPAIIESSSAEAEVIEPSQVVAIDENQALEPSTLYTTYTYYTTNYVGDATVIDSRFETETNIVTPSVVLPEQKSGARAIDINGGKGNALGGDEKGNKKNLIDGGENKEVIEATPALETVKLLPTGVVSINHGKIIDAEGISTTHFTTQAIGTYVDNLYAEVIESSTSIEIDEIRKAIQPTELEGSTRHHKTGLVRLVDGTIVNKNATTLYESKVIGTFIDGRYAQLIESTSSIIAAKIEPTAVNDHVNIQPTAANGDVVTPSSNEINPTPAVLEGSISESAGNNDEKDAEEKEDEKSVTRPLFPGKRPSLINRPFGQSSRSRSSFNPTFKRKNAANTPAIITPTEVTPTIKATAVKSLGNRFAAPRRSSALTSAFSPSSALPNIGSPSSSRRPSFTRPSSSVRASFQPTSSIRASKTSSSRIQPTSVLPGSIRRPLLRSSLAVTPRASSSISPSAPVIGRNRVIRPSLSIAKEVVQASITTPEPDEFETTLVTDEPSNADDFESESQEPVTTTTENSRRNNNPLLRVRRPPLTSGARPNPPAPTQRSATITTRRNPLARTSRATTQAPTTTTTERTTRNRPLFRPTFAPVSIGASRPRPSNLFPNRRTTTEPPQALDEEDINNSEEDYDTEETKIQEVKTPARTRGSRTKRQAIDYGTRPPNYNPRLFKKPTTSRNSRADYYTYDSEELIVTEPPKTRAATSRYNAQRSRGSSNFETETAKTRIKPTTSSSQGNNRLLFTLRKEDTSPAVTPRSSNFRRPQPASSFNANANNRRTTTTTRASKFRYNQQEARGNNNANSRGRNTNNRGRGTTSRSRTRDDTFNYVAPKFDGTITITHHIPTEVTIPVVVGKNTEYKSVITAKPSLEILGPNQYSTSNGKNGQTTLVVLEERTAINQNGATEITQFILSETPTTSITFTPTTIRGRKTSFSHVIPSTVYDAHPVVSTIQPQILPGSGSLANILLSQLLLSPQNQQLGALGLGNPLLGLNPQIQQIVPQMPATPVTEYKTRTTTYVTTIHEGKSTVLPITFRGQKIYTTVFDDVSQVITATEFITDTVVITPTQTLLPQVQQTANLNSLLLPLLLQQQQQQQQQQFNLQNINTQPAAFDILKPQLENIADDKAIQSITADETQNNSKEEDYEEVEEKPKKYFKAQKPAEKKYETSVVTIYVSGRVPGDFSTVLSTIISENPVYKRSAAYVDVKASALPNLDVLEAEASDNIYEYVLSGSSNDIEPEPTDDTNKETESLDVVFGDYNKYTSSVLM
ncbi:mucin-22-like [Chironomus tepperi]|uniref:mucin-22-like n=1 Tax=Chironomus tepperi TaxID=113505 RepID=UPI00391FB7C7